MRTFLFELRKIMLHRLGLVIVFVYVVITLGQMILLDSPYNANINDTKESYIQYMEKLSGILTDKNAEFVEQEGDTIDNAKTQRSFLYDQYFDGEIDEAQLRGGLDELEPVLSRESSYSIIYDQYQYISGDRENRYFLSTNGWNALLADNGFDILLVLVILLLVTPTFCGEYSCQMELLIVTSRNGKKNVWNKIVLSMLTVLILCVFTYISRYLFCIVKYGLPNGTYPLQSLRYFGECEKTVSLLQAYLIISLLKILGFMYFTAMILAISTLLKKYSSTVFLSAASVLFPYFAFSLEQYSRTPIPFSFMTATGYFLGSKYSHNYATGESKALYEEVRWPELGLLVMIGFTVMLLCILLVLWRNRNHWDISRKMVSGKKTIILFLCLAFAMSLCGCADLGEESNTAIYYNCNSPREYVSEDFIVTTDVSANMITVTNQETDDTFDLKRDAVSELSSISSFAIDSVFGIGDKVYYLMFYKSVIQIKEVDINTLTEKIIFEKPIEFTIDFLGMDINRNTKWSDFNTVMGVFMDDNFFYFTFSDNTSVGIRKVNRLTLSVIPLEIPIVNAFYDGEYYYYLNDVGVLTRYDLYTNDTLEISSVVARNCYFYQGQLYYVNRADQNYVYSCKADGTDQKLELAERCMNISFHNNELIAILVSGENIVLAEP